MHARILLGLVSLAALSACKKDPAPSVANPPKPPVEVARMVTVTKGVLDHSKWSKWIQGTPQILLVSPLDGQTVALISQQTRIFSALVAPASTDSSSTVNSPQSQLDTIKAAFPDRRQRYAYTYGSGGGTILDVPHRDRWDSYQRTIAHATLKTLPTIVNQLEIKQKSDLRDLDSQLTSTGLVGAQARADADWLRSTMAQTINRLKQIAKASTPAESTPLADQARAEWKTFEERDLSLLQKVVESKIVGRGDAASDGSFELQGEGQLVAVVTVAGRKLYFPINNSGELRFFNVEVVTRPADLARLN